MNVCPTYVTPVMPNHYYLSSLELYVVYFYVSINPLLCFADKETEAQRLSDSLVNTTYKRPAR